MAHIDHVGLAPSLTLSSLSVLEWPQTRIPTPHEREQIQLLISHDEEAIRHMKSELERLKTLKKKTWGIVRRYSEAMEVANNLRKVCVLRMNALVVARGKLGSFAAIRSITNEPGAPNHDASRLCKEMAYRGSVVERQISDQLRDLEAEFSQLVDRISQCSSALIAELQYLSTLTASTQRLPLLLSQRAADMAKRMDIMRVRRRVPVEKYSCLP